MAYVQAEIEVDDIDWESESVDTCLRVVNSILDEHKEVENELRRKLRIEQMSAKYSTRRAIEMLSLEEKVELFNEFFSDMLPNEIEAIKQILITKYNG